MGWYDNSMERVGGGFELWLVALPDWRRLAMYGLAVGVFSAFVGLAATELTVGVQERARLDALEGRVEALGYAPEAGLADERAMEEIAAEVDTYLETASSPTTPLIAGAVSGFVGGLFGAGIGALLWLAAPGVRLRLGRHEVALEGQQLELADVGAVELAGDRLVIRRRGRRPLETPPLLDPVTAARYLEAAQSELGWDPEAEAEGRREAGRALGRVRAAATQAS